MKANMIVKMPTVQKAKKLTQEDVWGKDGMIVARTNERCPIFKDIVPYKSVTAICNLISENEVIYWLEYVHGGNSISKRKNLKDGKIALRSDYQCW